jgi:hypothetical protein
MVAMAITLLCQRDIAYYRPAAPASTGDFGVWHKTMGQIYREAKRGTLPSQAPFSSPIAKVITCVLG